MDDPDRCPKCHKSLSLGSWPWCPHEQGMAPNVIDDDYGRDIVCETLGHEPVTYRTRSERRRLMQAHNAYEFVRHVPQQGSDKSPHTVDWSKGSMDAETLHNAEVLVTRQKIDTPPSKD